MEIGRALAKARDPVITNLVCGTPGVVSNEKFNLSSRNARGPAAVIMVIIILIAFVVTKYGTHIYEYQSSLRRRFACRSRFWQQHTTIDGSEPVIMHSPIKSGIRVFNYVCARRDFPLSLSVFLFCI